MGGMGKKLGSRSQEEARPPGRHSTRCPRRLLRAQSGDRAQGRKLEARLEAL